MLRRTSYLALITVVGAGATFVACAPLENEDIGGSAGSGDTDSADAGNTNGGTMSGDGDGDGDGDADTGDGDGDGDGDGGIDPDCYDTPGMVCVPAGLFTQGDDAGNPDEQPEREVDLLGFEIDALEVIASDYDDCVTAGTCTAAGTGPGCTSGVAGLEDRPINCVTWDQAAAYCAWLGKRLPTEAEWEKAARGVDARPYPWGMDPPSCTLAIFDDGTGAGCGSSQMGDVGTLPLGASPYGAFDMAGNAEEWVADWYDPNYYAIAPNQDPPGPATGTERGVRGGAFDDTATGLRSAARDHALPDTQGPGLGFRCAK